MRKKRVMLVEDEPITAMDQFDILSKLGLEVTSFSFSGEVALEKVKTEKPDLVVMDIMLQGDMNGCQAGEKIRTEYGIPVVYVTALGRSFATDISRFPDGVRFVTKPYTEEALSQAICEALKEAGTPLT